MLGLLIVIIGGSAAAAPAATSITPPGAPTGLVATAGDARAALSWMAPASDGGASIIGYRIYEGTSQDAASSTQVANSDITGDTFTAAAGSGTVTGLVNGTTYYFWVTAVNDFNLEGPKSGEAPAIPAAAPGPPTGLIAMPGNAQVTLSWTAPASDGGAPVTGYDVYDGTTADFTASTPVTSSATTSATVTGLASGATYFFRVTAVNTAGQSLASGQASATLAAAPVPPGPPTGLIAMPGNGQVTLSWTAPASDGGAPVTGYDVYDGTTADFTAKSLVTSSATTGATVTDLASGATYYFWVTAVNAAGPSAASGRASATLAAAPAAPGPPTGLTAMPGNGQVTLSWTAPASDGGAPVTGYDVYDGTTADFTPGIPVTSSATTGTTLTGLASGTTYYFRVIAVNTAGPGPLSGVASARTASATSAATPASSTATATSGAGTVANQKPTSVPEQLIAVLAAIATVAVAVALTLVMRGRRVNVRSPRHVTPASQVHAEPGPRPPDSVRVRETGREPAHTVLFEPDHGTSTTTIEEKS